MSRRTRRSSRRRSYRSWPAVRPTARSCGPAWDRRSEPRGRLRAAPWPRPAHSRHSPPSPPCSPGACEARPPACGAPGLCSGRFAAIPTHECMHPPCPWRHRYPRQRDHFVPSSTPFLARFGLEALATVRVEEDTGAVPRSVTSSVAFGRNGLSSSNGRLVRNRPFAHSDRFSGHKGAGNTGCPLHPQPRVQSIGSTRVSHHRFTGTPGLPCAMVLTASFGLSPVTGLSCHRHPQEALLLENLTPASGRQDHTTSPSAETRPRQKRAPRPPHPAPNVVTMRNAPPAGYGKGLDIHRICISEKQKYFFERGWTNGLDAKSRTAPDGQISWHSQEAPVSEAIHKTTRKPEWIASSRSLSSGAHSRDPLAPLRKPFAFVAGNDDHVTRIPVG